MWSYLTSQTFSILSASHERFFPALQRLCAPGMRADLAAAPAQSRQGCVFIALLRREESSIASFRRIGIVNEEVTLSAPLPRGPQWLDASAFHDHGNLMERVFGGVPSKEKLQTPLMYQGASDDFLGPNDDMPLPSEDDGIDFEAEIAVMVDNVPLGTPADAALSHVKLLLLVNDASLRAFAGREIQSGFGFIQAKPSTSFAPVAVSPDELGAAWRNGRLRLPVSVSWNQRWFGHPHGGAMGFGFQELIAHAARTRILRAGTIIGSGTVSNEDYRTVGSGCIAEKRAIETLDSGKPTTPYMKFGDTVQIEIHLEDGTSVFGAIDQRMVQSPAPRPS
jgi:fumarylacetoacetate (FAA) hydrolase